MVLFVHKFLIQRVATSVYSLITPSPHTCFSFTSTAGLLRLLPVTPLAFLQVIERRENMDWTRHAVFCTFGFAYLGGFQYYLYNIKFTQVRLQVQRAVKWR